MRNDNNANANDNDNFEIPNNRWFLKMPRPNTWTYNTMLKGLAKSSRSTTQQQRQHDDDYDDNINKEEALQLFQEMKRLGMWDAISVSPSGTLGQWLAVGQELLDQYTVIVVVPPSSGTTAGTDISRLNNDKGRNDYCRRRGQQQQQQQQQQHPNSEAYTQLLDQYANKAGHW
jgi:hypothetical protein